MGLAILVVLAVRKVVLVGVADEVTQGEAVVRGDEVQAPVRVVLEQVGAPLDAACQRAAVRVLVEPRAELEQSQVAGVKDVERPVGEDDAASLGAGRRHDLAHAPPEGRHDAELGLHGLEHRDQIALLHLVPGRDENGATSLQMLDGEGRHPTGAIRDQPDSDAFYSWGALLPALAVSDSAIIGRLVERGAQGVIAGCTEIELLVGPDDVDVPYFPTTALHA